jgi:elongation factor Ts
MSTPVTPQLVKQLRDRTDQPMGLCKQALDVSSGDLEKAIAYLQTLNKGMQAKREGNETAEGRIGVFFDNNAKVAAIVEMRCESAPSAKSDQFIALATDVAKFVATSKATTVPAILTETYGPKGTLADRIDDTVGVIREKMVLQRFQRLAGGVYGSYIHHDGTVGVLVECKGASPNDELLRDVAAHCAALNPPYATIADVPAELLEKEKAIVKAEMDADPKNASKPANIIEKIADGKLTKRLADVVMVLSEQQMANDIKYPATTVKAALKKAGLEPVKFIRFKVGAVAL